MTYRHLICAATVASMTQACVVYDRNCHGGDCSDQGYSGGTYACPPDGTTDQPDQPEPEPSYQLFLEPDAAEAGQTVIAYLTAEGEFEVSEVASVLFVGDVDVLAMDVRSDELVLTLDVWEDAELGRIDALLTLADGTGLVFPDAFEILEATTIVEDPDTGDDCDTGS